MGPALSAGDRVGRRRRVPSATRREPLDRSRQVIRFTARLPQPHGCCEVFALFCFSSRIAAIKGSAKGATARLFSGAAMGSGIGLSVWLSAFAAARRPLLGIGRPNTSACFHPGRCATDALPEQDRQGVQSRTVPFGLCATASFCMSPHLFPHSSTLLSCRRRLTTTALAAVRVDSSSQAAKSSAAR